MASYPPPPPSPQAYIPTKAAYRAQRRAEKAQGKAQRQQMRMQMRLARRSSIVGPMVLLAAGVLFMLAELGRVRWFTMLTWYGRWWPLLLVGAGLLLLAEWAWDQHVQGQRAAAGLPPRSVHVLGGGTVALLIFLAILGGASHVGGRWWVQDGDNFRFNVGDFDRALGDPHDSDTSLSQAIPNDGSLTIDNARGNVTVSGTSDDGQIHIACHKQVFAMNDGDASRKADSIQPTVNNDAGRVSITVPSVEGGHADLTIETPRTIALTISADRGDVHVSNLRAAVIVNGNRGSVDIGGVNGPATVHLHNSDASFSAHSIDGAVTVDGRTGDLNVSDVRGAVMLTGDFFGTTHLERVNGPVHFKTSRTDFEMARLDGEMELDTGSDLRAEQVLGPVMLTTRQRNIVLERVQGAVQVVNRDGSVTLTSAGPLANINIQNKRGQVDVGVPENASFVMQATTRHGDVENDFNVTKQGSAENPQLMGTVGHGGPLVHVETSDGDVIVRKSMEAPLPPVPPAPPALVMAPPPAPPSATGKRMEAPAPPALPGTKAHATPKAPKAPKAEAAMPAPPAPPQP